ncbi:pentatricopeptide repeat-containing protein At1g53600, mitochondrial-like, partial [Papaver somniferum]|uniref:pentatricopeptide repeat-containing protein At1g53600, mitochondrial-like n=1 Tax=Papaver somniferum TaxID=3469 RepID=UPI000E6FF551
HPAILTLSLRTLTNSKPNSSKIISTKFLVQRNSEITKNGRNGNLREAESIFNQLPTKNIISWTAMLTEYAENNEITKARRLFDEMPQRNTATWNALITAYTRSNSHINEAYELFCKVPERNVVTYAVMITGFVRVGRLNEAEKIYYEMPVIGRDPVVSNAMINGYLKLGELDRAVYVFDSMAERNVVSWSSLLDGYCKNGKINEAEVMFQKMPEKNVVSWTTMISGYMKSGQRAKGFELFSKMRREEHVEVNSITLTVILETCGSLGRFKEGIQIHGLVILMGFDFDVYLDNSVINMYCRVARMDDARNVFDMMNKKDVVSWNSLITGFFQNADTEKACRYFEKMPSKDVVSWTNMIMAFSNQGRMEDSMRLFNEMPRKDGIAWTAIISGFVASGRFEKAFRMFIQMVREAIKPNSHTMSSVLCASSGLASLNQGEQIHANVVKLKMESELSIQNSLISMYSKCGDVNTAYKIFSSISTPDLLSFNSMITSFAQHGLGKEALELFTKMLIEEGCEPNEITFLGVLSACVHVGLVNEGWNYFRAMSSMHHIEPGPDHYACMIDLLARSGLFTKALDLIQSMPMKPHSGIWGALLSGSRTHMNVDIAELSARHLIELEPDNATPYVVLSNIYSVAGLQEDGKELRLIKNRNGVKKSPGCSWVT